MTDHNLSAFGRQRTLMKSFPPNSELAIWRVCTFDVGDGGLVFFDPQHPHDTAHSMEVSVPKGTCTINAELVRSPALPRGRVISITADFDASLGADWETEGSLKIESGTAAVGPVAMVREHWKIRGTDAKSILWTGDLDSGGWRQFRYEFTAWSLKRAGFELDRSEESLKTTRAYSFPRALDDATAAAINDRLARMSGGGHVRSTLDQSSAELRERLANAETASLSTGRNAWLAGCVSGWGAGSYKMERRLHKGATIAVRCVFIGD